MMGLSSMMAHLTAFCNVMFSGRRYPTEGTEEGGGEAAAGLEEGAAAGLEEGAGAFTEEAEEKVGVAAGEAAAAAMGLDTEAAFTRCRS